MAIRKGDRLGHLGGFLGTALADEAGGMVEVRHDNGAVSTWVAADASVINRGPLDNFASSAVTPARSSSKRPSRKKSTAKRASTKKAAKKRTTRKRTTRKPKATAARSRATKTKGRMGKKRRRV